MSEFVHNLRHPDPSLSPVHALPLSLRNPVLLWKGIALVCALGWLLTWIFR
jgi:hypothetical protein